MGAVYQAVVGWILLYGCETWLVQAANERMSAVFDSDRIRRVENVRRRDCILTVELRRRLSLTSMRVQWKKKASKEGLIGLAVLRDVPRVDRSGTSSLVARTSWIQTKDVGHGTQARPGTSLWTANIRPRTIEKWLNESLLWIRTGQSSRWHLHAWVG